MAREIILNNYCIFLAKESVEEYIESGQCDKEIIDNIENCVVMKSDNLCIGFSIIIANKLHLIMIDREFQNKKYGTKLLAYIENMLFTKYKTIELQTFVGNIIAIKFYEKNGWNKIEKISMDNMVFYKFEKNKKNKCE